MQKYWEKEIWKNFVEEQIIPLNRSAKNLELFSETLRRKVHNIPYSEIAKDEFLVKLLIDDRLLYDFFGVRENINMGYDVEFAGFKDLFYNIRVQTDKIIDYSRRCGIIDCSEKNDNIVFEELKDPARLATLIEEFYQKIINLTANSNELVRFIMSIQNITQKYLEYVNQDLKENEKLHMLAKNVGLCRYPDLKVFINDDLLFLPEESLGGMIYNLNKTIWEYGRIWGKTLKFPDVEKDYFDKAFNALLARNVPLGVGYHTESGYIRYHIHFSGKKCAIVRYDRTNSSPYEVITIDSNISIPKFFHDIAPFLYLGVLKIGINDTIKKLNYFHNCLSFDLKFGVEQTVKLGLYDINIEDIAKKIINE